MGEVWAAYDRKLGRRVAIKLVTEDESDLDDTAARLRREYELSSLLRGPAFAEVYGSGTHRPDPSSREPERAYLVMELLEGETLEARLAQRGRLSTDETREVLAGVAVGLRVAHALHIVHRDLKPSNVFFAKAKGASSGVQALDGRKEIVKLVDFGIAKNSWATARLTKPGMLLGSCHYMSPEQIRGADVSTRSDLWSLAIVLFRALTGVRPYKGTPAEVFAGTLEDPPPRITSIDRTLPRGFDAFFRRALEKDPGMRFSTIDELVEAFDSAMKTKPRDPSELELDIAWDAEDERVTRTAESLAPPAAQRNSRPSRSAFRSSRNSVDVVFPSDRPGRQITEDDILVELASKPPGPIRRVPAKAEARALRVLVSAVLVVLVAILVVLVFFARR